jgi:hypothetical protein
MATAHLREAAKVTPSGLLVSGQSLRERARKSDLFSALSRTLLMVRA